MFSVLAKLADPSIGAELVFDGGYPLGLLMIPKSLASLAVALIVYRRLPSMAPITSR